jgi:hypothetical protein
MSSLGTADSGPVTGPGTANTSRPHSPAWSTVMEDPLPDAPSTTTTARDIAATIRFRAGKRNGSARVPGGYSLRMVPASAMRSRSRRLLAGYARSMPHPSTATVRPSARSAPPWDAASIPRAAPLTTTTPAAASPAPIAVATSEPYDVQFRAPTIATAGRWCSTALPRR